MPGRPEDGEEAAGHPQPFDVANFAAWREVEPRIAKREHAGERRLPIANLPPDRRADLAIAAGLPAPAAIADGRISTSSWGAATGRPRKLTASSSWKIVVLAPMPRPSEITAAA